MSRIGELDLPERLAPVLPRPVTTIMVALSCAAAAWFVRMLLDMVAPGAAVFPLVFPAAMAATLFAGWRAGTIAGGTAILYAWYFLYPIQGSFRFASKSAVASIVTVTAACALTVLLAELFRRAARRAQAERDREIAERDLLIREIEHRVKNNFAIVASMLELQRRRSGEPATREALGVALLRVESIARAHRHLYRDGSAAAVDMGDYLNGLCAALADALGLHGAIRLECRSVRAAMPRDRAVSIGLIVNELVTNAVKHAFGDRDRGTILVAFDAAPPGWQLTVADNGVGIPAAAPAAQDGGLGRRLIDGFARQADGVLTTAGGPEGTRVTLTLAP